MMATDGWVLRVSSKAAEREAAMAHLFTAHFGRMRRLAFLMTGDAAASEDIAMEAFVRTCARWGRVSTYDAPEMYVRKAVINLCRSRVRRAIVERRSTHTAPPPEPDHDQAHDVRAAVRALPPRQRACVILRYYDDLPEATIAHVLGCSTGTVKSQLSKARATLSRSLSVTGGPDV
jgi:RNA polymerase sigma-70 factor (sigma-E family)